MKRRSLMRFAALAMAVMMVGSDFMGTNLSTYAAENNDTKTESSAKKDDNSAGKSDTGSDSDSGTDFNYNERLTTNYTTVSSKYTFKKYTGSTVKLDIAKAYQSTVNSKGETVNTLTADTNNYSDASKVVQLTIGDTANFIINAPEDGVYIFGFDQLAYDEESILSTEMTFKLNGAVPFFECNRLVFESIWHDKDETSKDRYGNQIISIPDKVLNWSTAYIKDASYRYTTPLQLELKKGENTVTMNITEGSVKIGNFYLEAEKKVPAYQKGNSADGDFFKEFRAELPTYKNDSSIRPTCEYDIDLTPYETKKKVLNIVDSASFADSGMSMSYEVDVEKDGYYYLGFNYRQTDKVDFPVFMNIYIDGEFQNDEMVGYEFYYAKSFKKMTVKGSDGDNMAIKLTKGKHLIKIELANDKIRECLEKFDVIMSEVNDLSLEITKVTGAASSKYRSIDIDDYIDDVDGMLQGWIDTLQDCYDYLKDFSDAKNSGTISSLKTAISRLKDLKKHKKDIPYRKNELCTSTSSVNQDIANVITELNDNKISLDSVYVYQDDSADQIPGKTNIFVKIWESIKRFFASFGSQDYSINNTDEAHLQVWVNRPRQYLEIIQQLVDESFTPKTGIEVDLCIMPDASKLILANAAGNAPDVAQAVDYAQPFELAVRGALEDVTQFDDYAEVMARFPEGLLVPSTIGDKIYSMPETFYFWVLFYRTDILGKLNIDVPTTIDEVQKIIPELKNRGLEFFYPTSGTTGQRSFAMTTPFFYQYGASLYNQSDENWDGVGQYYGTAISSANGLKAFETLTELFTIYDIPQETSSFYQHFRNGDIPVGISDYFMYSLLINAAPEIENSWNITLVPGIPATDVNGKQIVDEDGNAVINRQTAGAAQSSVIMKSGYSSDIELKNGKTMDRKQAAWEYLKWWMEKDTQVEFGVILQTTYGKEYIWNSANMEAFSELPWKSRDKHVILEAMKNIEESPRIPGTYMLERELSNAYINVVINGMSLRTALDAAIRNIDKETKRKLQEFDYIDSDGKNKSEYKIPSVETVREILAKGKKSN